MRRQRLADCPLDRAKHPGSVRVDIRPVEDTHVVWHPSAERAQSFGIDLRRLSIQHALDLPPRRGGSSWQSSRWSIGRGFCRNRTRTASAGGIPKYRGAVADSSAVSKSIWPDKSIGGANFSRPNVRSASLGRAFGGSSSVDPRSRTTGPSSLSRALLSPAILRQNILQDRLR
jgi:hypothetical protein